MHRSTTFVLVLLATLFTVTCARITVNVYFPASELRDAATEIEQEVRGSGDKDQPPAEKPSDPKPQGSLLWPALYRVRVAFSFTPPSAMAQTPDINISTPGIRRLIDSRKQRYGSLAPLLQRCVLGENNRGLLDLRPTPGVSLKDKASAQALLGQENRDRQQLYQELAKANELPANRIDEIAKIFAAVNRREARPGWCIQDEGGNWGKK
jgi:uncharacterized protein YdbL (DUF1318 family)